MKAGRWYEITEDGNTVLAYCADVSSDYPTVWSLDQEGQPFSSSFYRYGTSYATWVEVDPPEDTTQILRPLTPGQRWVISDGTEITIEKQDCRQFAQAHWTALKQATAVAVEAQQ